MDPQQVKSSEIRKRMKILRQERSFDAEGHFLLEKQASAIRERLENVLLENHQLKWVLCFYPIGSEVPLLSLYKKIITSYSLYFPVTGKQDLSFYRVSSIEKGAFAEGKMRIPEPVERSDRYSETTEKEDQYESIPKSTERDDKYGSISELTEQSVAYERDFWENGMSVYHADLSKHNSEMYGKEKSDKLALGFSNSKPLKYEKIYHTAAIVPGLAFSVEHKGRIGYGGGYYDRFLMENPDILKVGVCYEFQMVDDLPQNPWDVPMDCIVTDERVVW